MGEKSKSRGWCGWFIAVIVLASVVLAVVYTVKSRMKKSGEDDGTGPVPGPPGAIDKKYADALKLALQFFDIQKCNDSLLQYFIHLLPSCNHVFISYRFETFQIYYSLLI